MLATVLLLMMMMTMLMMQEGLTPSPGLSPRPSRPAGRRASCGTCGPRPMMMMMIMVVVVVVVMMMMMMMTMMTMMMMVMMMMMMQEDSLLLPGLLARLLSPAVGSLHAVLADLGRLAEVLRHDLRHLLLANHVLSLHGDKERREMF
jgi:hypothetical protein